MKRWRTRGSARQHVQGGRLEFALTASRLTHISIRIERHTGPGDFDVIRPRAKTGIRGTRAVFWFDDPVNTSPGTVVAIEARYEGEPVVLVQVEWLSAGGQQGLSGWNAAGPHLFPEWFVQIDPEERKCLERQVLILASTAIYDPAAPGPRNDRLSSVGNPIEDLLSEGAVEDEFDYYFNKRFEAVKLDIKARLFFAKFDQATLSKSDAGTMSGIVLGNLKTHARARVYESEVMNRGIALRATDAWASTLWRVAATFDFWVKESGINEDGLPWAFELFAAGKLGVYHPDPAIRKKLVTHGGPNGWFYFLFAELALACSRLEVPGFEDSDRARWRRRLSFLVRSGHFMTQHPWPFGSTTDGASDAYRLFDGYSRRIAELEFARTQYELSSKLVSDSSADEELEYWENYQGLVLALVPDTELPRSQTGYGPDALWHSFNGQTLPDLTQNLNLGAPFAGVTT